MVANSKDSGSEQPKGASDQGRSASKGEAPRQLRTATKLKYIKELLEKTKTSAGDPVDEFIARVERIVIEEAMES